MRTFERQLCPKKVLFAIITVVIAVIYFDAPTVPEMDDDVSPKCMKQCMSKADNASQA